VFEVVDENFSRPLDRFNGGNSGGFSSEEISKSGRFASLGVAGGDDESVDGGEEGDCFFRLRELYVRWTLEDINFDARKVDVQFRVGDATRLFGFVYIGAKIEKGKGNVFTYTNLHWQVQRQEHEQGLIIEIWLGGRLFSEQEIITFWAESGIIMIPLSAQY
jgi:hypothetical protein